MFVLPLRLRTEIESRILFCRLARKRTLFFPNAFETTEALARAQGIHSGHSTYGSGLVGAWNALEITTHSLGLGPMISIAVFICRCDALKSSPWLRNFTLYADAFVSGVRSTLLRRRINGTRTARLIAVLAIEPNFARLATFEDLSTTDENRQEPGLA